MGQTRAASFCRRCPYDWAARPSRGSGFPTIENALGRDATCFADQPQSDSSMPSADLEIKPEPVCYVVCTTVA